MGQFNCFSYDALHRNTGIGHYGAGGASNTPNMAFVYDNATVNGVPMANGKGRLVQAYTCLVTCTPKMTDLGFSYSARGEVTDVYQSTPNSGGFYRVSATYHPHGPLHTLENLAGLPKMTYAGLDGQGRITTVTAASGAITGLVTNTIYNNTDPVTANQPLGALTSVSLGVNGGATDVDSFNFDKNTGRLLQWQYSVNNQLQVGALTWNANGSLASLNITDAFNTANVQNCSFAHDDLARIAGVNCGTGKWNQSFSYDPYGNINKTSSGPGTNFQPTYNAANNRISSLPGVSAPTYDANGNLTSINLGTVQTYQWDADGRVKQIDSVALTYDALGRMVEKNRSGAYTQIVYTPTGEKLALMNGQTLVKAFVPLPGGATAVYNSSGLQYYRHSDWLGSSRLASKPDRTFYFDGAYAPFGEDYAKSGTDDLNFTGQNQDTVSGLYDFMFREYSSVQGRWISPDPAGLAAVNLTDPQSWNRYAYVVNSPLEIIDPLGLTGDAPKLECLLSDTGGCLVQVGVVGGRCWDDGLFMPCGIKFTLIRAGAICPGCPPGGWIDPMTGIIFTPCKAGEGRGGDICNAGHTGLSLDDLRWLKDFLVAFHSREEQLKGQQDALRKGYYKCLGQELGVGATAPLVTHTAAEVVTRTVEKNPGNVVGKAAGAYYHFTDGRFTAWGKFSKVIVPNAVAKVKNFFKGVNIAAWAYFDVELALAIGKCKDKL